jgi:hypothetical protein
VNPLEEYLAAHQKRALETLADVKGELERLLAEMEASRKEFERVIEKLNIERQIEEEIEQWRAS